jgi:nicotinamide phosphoribosyltransferase
VNPILKTDSYKASHFLQYPPGTERVFSYIEARSKNDCTLFFGLQAIMNDLLSKPITAPDVDEAEALFKAHGLPFNRAGWDRIVTVHGGYMPALIRAVPEGTLVPNRNVLVTVESTDPQLPWVTSYLETALLRVWYPTSVATNSFKAKIVIHDALRKSADNLDGLPFKLHDFGARGVSSGESAALGGMGHLVNFLGTDTVEALVAARRHYGEPMAGFSIPAAEHSTITSWGRERERDAYSNMLDQFAKPGALLAVVSDSYDIYAAIDKLWGEDLRQRVIDSGATVVIRPDSGDPEQVVPQVLRRLHEKFGATFNEQGYALLKNVRVIQGDGIDSPQSIHDILREVMRVGYSADNVAFGMGGGLLQKVNRDTYGFAMKCSAIMIDGAWHDVFKDPITDPGKKSKRGRVRLVQTGTGLKTVDSSVGWQDDMTEIMQVVYDGRHVKQTSFAEIRSRAAQELKRAL